MQNSRRYGYAGDAKGAIEWVLISAESAVMEP